MPNYNTEYDLFNAMKRTPRIKKVICVFQGDKPTKTYEI
jgi:hypothetical protein